MSNTKCHPMAKRLLSVLFAITLVTGLVPISAYAAIGDSKSTAPAETTQSQEQETQGTDSQDTSKDSKDADSDGSASDKGASTEEPATEGESTTSSSDDNGVSSNANDANAISLADEGIAVAADIVNIEKRYNPDKDEFNTDNVYEILKDNLGSPTLGYFDLDGEQIYKSNIFFPAKSFYPEAGHKYVVKNYIKTGTIKREWKQVGTLTFLKQWDTTFSSSLTEGGATDLEGNTLSKLTSDDGADVKFKVKQVAVSGTEGVYYDAVVTCDGETLTPENGVYSIKAKANSTVYVEYQTPKATISVDYDVAGANKVTVGNDVVTAPNQDVKTSVGFETPASVTPKKDYAVTSVKLTGGEYSGYDLLTAGSFADNENRTATFTIPSDLDKNVAYTLSIETKQCELKLQGSPSAAVKGLTDTAKIKQRVIDGVLDLENSVPSNISADDLKIEYLAGEIAGYKVWKDISESVLGRSFGDKDSETIRITYNGNSQYCKLSSDEFEIQIIDGRIATHITANETVSVKYAPESDLKKAIEAAIAPKVYDEDGDQISDPQVEFDYSNFNRAVGTQYVTVKYPGNEDYKNSELTVEVQIAKGDAKVSVDSQSITYGGSFNQPIVSASPTEAKPVYAIVGIEGDGSSYVSIDFGSITVNDALGGIIPDLVPAKWREKPLQDVFTDVLGNEFSANDLLNGLDKIEGYLAPLDEIPGVDVSGMISRIRAVLNKVSEIAPGAMDSKIIFGGTPDQAGVYAVTAVTVNPNYTNDVAVGYLTIAPATQNVELRFKAELPDYSISIDEANNFNFSAGLYQGELDITSKGNVSTKFIGTDYEGNAYVSSSAPTDPGVYSQVVTNIGGNYYASPIHREFEISRIATTLTISFDGTTDYEQSVVYTGSQINPTFTVKAGAVDLDPSRVWVMYTGKTQSGDWYLSTEAPTEAGEYFVGAIYPKTGYYDRSDASCKLTIKQQSIDPTSPDYRDVKVQGIDDVVYDGNEHVWNPVVKDAAGNELVRMTDYVVSYEPYDFINAGEIKVTIAGIGNYTGTVEKTYKIAQQSINPEDVDNYLDVQILDPENTVYNGEEQKWSPEVNHKDGSELVMGNDYTVTYMRGNQVTDDFTSAGEITVVIEGQGNYTGTVTKSYKILKQSVNPDEEDAYLGVQIDNPENAVYNGKDQKWAPAVTDKAGNPLTEGTDYTVEYSTEDFINAGKVTVTITGIGNYTGEVERTYTIEKAAIEVADSATKVYNGAEQMFYVQATNATGLVEGEVLTLSDAQVKGTEPGVYTEVSPYKWVVVKADGKTDSTGNYTINVSGTLTITAADSAAADTNNGNSAKADKGTAPQTGDTTAPLAAGAAIAAAAALVALFLSRKLRRNGTR